MTDMHRDRVDRDGQNSSGDRTSPDIVDDNAPPSPNPVPPSSPLMPYTGLDLHLQGVEYYNNSQWAEAESLFRRASQERLATLGPHDSRTLSSRGLLAMSVWYGRNYREAEILFRSLAEDCQDGFGEIENRGEDYKTWLGMALSAQKKFKKAEVVFREALRNPSRGLHRTRLELKLELAILLCSQRCYPEAEKILTSMRSEPYDPDCWVFKNVRGTQDNELDNLLAKVLLKQGKTDLARVIAPTTVQLYKYREANKRNNGRPQAPALVTQPDTHSHSEEHSGKGEQTAWFKMEETQKETPSESDRPNDKNDQTQIRLEEIRRDSPTESKGQVNREDHNTQTLPRDRQQEIPSHSQTPASRDNRRYQVQIEDEIPTPPQELADRDNQQTDVLLEEVPQDVPDVVEPQGALNKVEVRDIPQIIEPQDTTSRGKGFPTLSNLGIHPRPASVEPQDTQTEIDSPDPERFRNITLYRRLDKFFSRHEGPLSPYSDSEIYEISNLLKYVKPSWSRVPRTYIVLRIIGGLEFLDQVIQDKFSDYWFPVVERRVPACLSPRMRTSFFQSQELILTKSMDLEKMEDGQHQSFKDSETLQFESQGVLGSGSYGQVDEVLSSISFKVYARKLIYRWRYELGGTGKEAMNRIVAEIKIMKKVKHEHAVRIVGSYTDPRYVGLIMSPVAEMNLAAYLKGVRSSRYAELRTFFGCLTTALKYLHEQNIRHKDIKPANILVDHGKVLFTDFGLSIDSTDLTGSTTVGNVSGMTPRYCSPEVANYDPRNSSSDIWSLGVVFLEMAVVLKERKIQEMYDFLRSNGTDEEFVRSNLEGVAKFIALLKAEEDYSDNAVFPWIQDMLQLDRKKRPSAASLVKRIVDHSLGGGNGHSFCGICCINPFEHHEPEFQYDGEVFVR